MIVKTLFNITIFMLVSAALALPYMPLCSYEDTFGMDYSTSLDPSLAPHEVELEPDFEDPLQDRERYETGEFNAEETDLLMEERTPLVPEDYDSSPPLMPAE